MSDLKNKLRINSRNLKTQAVKGNGRVCEESLSWLRAYRRNKVSSRSLPHQPSAA